MLPAVAKSAPCQTKKSLRQTHLHVPGSEKNLGAKIPWYFLTENFHPLTPFVTLTNQISAKQRKLLVAGIASVGSWLKECHLLDTKRLKVICRAVHDATLSTQQENSNILLCCFTSLLQIQIFKERHSEERLVNAR